MLFTLFLKRLISIFALLVSLFSFSLALAVDSDGDGVDDIQDAYPEDASRQYLSFDEALGEIEDPNLRRCIEERQNGAETAGELAYLDCNHYDVGSLSGIEHFTELEQLYLNPLVF